MLVVGRVVIAGCTDDCCAAEVPAEGTSSGMSALNDAERLAATYANAAVVKTLFASGHPGRKTSVANVSLARKMWYCPRNSSREICTPII